MQQPGSPAGDPRAAQGGPQAWGAPPGAVLPGGAPPGGAAPGPAPPGFPQMEEPVRPPSVEEHGAVAVLFLGDPHISVRFQNYVRAFARFGFHVDWLGYYTGNEPDWVKQSDWVRHHHMDAAFLSPAPDSFLFWLIYPIQLVFDFLYTVCHLFLFCRGNLDLILCMASPFRPAAIFACYFAAALMQTRVILDVSGLDASASYTGARAGFVRRLERAVGRRAWAAPGGAPAAAARGAGDAAGDGENAGAAGSPEPAAPAGRVYRPMLVAETPSLRSAVVSAAQGANYLFTSPLQVFSFDPLKHHALFSKLAFAQPEQTIAGVRTLFHYLRPEKGGAQSLSFNPKRPLLILVPCAYRGEDDFEAAFSLAEHLEDYFSGLQSSLNKERFRSAIMLFCGRSDPLQCPDGPEYFTLFSQRMQRFNSGYTARRPADKEARPAAPQFAEKLAKRARGARYCRAAYVYLEREDYFCVLSCADLVLIPRNADRFTAAMLEALMYQRYVIAKLASSPAQGTPGAAPGAAPEAASATTLKPGGAAGSLVGPSATAILERCGAAVVGTTEDFVSAVDLFIESREQRQRPAPGEAGGADEAEEDEENEAPGPHGAPRGPSALSEAAPMLGSPATANPAIRGVFGQIREEYSFYRGFQSFILPLIVAEGVDLPEFIRECKQLDDKNTQYRAALDRYNKAMAAYMERAAREAAEEARRAPRPGAAPAEPVVEPAPAPAPGMPPAGALVDAPAPAPAPAAGTPGSD